MFETLLKHLFDHDVKGTFFMRQFLEDMMPKETLKTTMQRFDQDVAEAKNYDCNRKYEYVMPVFKTAEKKSRYGYRLIQITAEVGEAVFHYDFYVDKYELVSAEPRQNFKTNSYVTLRTKLMEPHFRKAVALVDPMESQYFEKWIDGYSLASDTDFEWHLQADEEHLSLKVYAYSTQGERAQADGQYYIFLPAGFVLVDKQTAKRISA